MPRSRILYCFISLGLVVRTSGCPVIFLSLFLIIIATCIYDQRLSDSLQTFNPPRDLESAFARSLPFPSFHSSCRTCPDSCSSADLEVRSPFELCGNPFNIFLTYSAKPPSIEYEWTSAGHILRLQAEQARADVGRWTWGHWQISDLPTKLLAKIFIYTLPEHS